MPENTAQPYLQNTVPPWKQPSSIQETIEETQSPNNQGRGFNKKILIWIGIVGLLVGVLATGFVTGSLNLQKVKEVVPLNQDKKYETTFYEVSLPKDWNVSVQGGTIIASDPENPIREVTISTIEYSQTLINKYKQVRQKDPHVYHARYLTAECHIDKTIGEYCDRIYYLWNEEQQTMAKVTIKWEKLSIAEAAETYEGLKKAQSEGVTKAHPSIESMEKKIFGSFRFKDLTEN